MALLILEFGCPEIQTLMLWVSQMLIGQAVLMIERALLVVVFFFISNNLVAWHSKKQTSTSLSTAEAEYIVAGSCCTQLLWMKQMLFDYGIDQKTMVIYWDNKSAIDISDNLVQHSRTKYIDICHHFI